MTTDWKSTIHHAYTTPSFLHPTFEKSIPDLIRDEISKLANLKLFQTNIQASSSHSQVPVDMKFTDDSLNIRISKNAPWISLVPSTEPMSPEERAVDAVRKDVMEKIALLWGGIPDSASDESGSEQRGSSGSSAESNTSTSRRTRSRRTRRAERNRGLNHSRGDSITISGNTIDSSTHTTTNNYYGCMGSHPDFPSNTDAKEKTTSKRSLSTQTDFTSTPLGTPLPVYQSNNAEELSSSGDSRNSDASEDESNQSFTSFIDRPSTEKKTSSDVSDTESESSYYPQSSDESECSSNSSFSLKSQTRDKISPSDDSSNESENKISSPSSLNQDTSDLIIFSNDEDSAEAVNSTINDLENLLSDLETIISKEKVPTPLDDLDISESEDETSSNSSLNQDKPNLMTFSEEDDKNSAQLINSTIHDLENILSDFEGVITKDKALNRSNDSSKQRPTKRSMENGNMEQQPVSKKLRRDSFEGRLKKAKQTLRKDRPLSRKISVKEPEWVQLAHRKTKYFIDPLDLKQRVHFDAEIDIIPALHKTPSKAADPFAEVKQFVKEFNTQLKPVAHRRAIIELQEELAKEQPDKVKINNLVFLLHADPLQVKTEIPIALKQAKSLEKLPVLNTLRKQNLIDSFKNEPESLDLNKEPVLIKKIIPKKLFPTDSINYSEDCISSEDAKRLNSFINNSMQQINAFIELVQNTQEELDSQILNSLLKNRAIFINLQDLLDLNRQLVIGSLRVNTFLDQLDVDTLKLVHNDFALKLPYINKEDSSNEETTLAGSVKAQVLPSAIDTSVQTDNYQSDEEIELLKKLQELSVRFGQLDQSFSLAIQSNLTRDNSAQTYDYQTNRESRLRKKIQALSKKYENLAGIILKQSKAEEKQRHYIRELQFKLDTTKKELEYVLQKFEKLAESSQVQFKSMEEEHAHSIELESKVQALEEMNKDLISALTPRKKPKIASKIQQELLEREFVEERQKQSTELETELTDIKPTELPLHVKNALKFYEDIHSDLKEMNHTINGSQSFYKKYKESNIVTRLTNLAKSLENTVTSNLKIDLPKKEEIHKAISQIEQLFLQEQKLEKAELEEIENDFDQRLKIYNELTSDLIKIQKEGLTLADFYAKYSDSKALNELNIFAEHDRDMTPSKASIQDKIHALRGLLIQFDNYLETTDL